MAAGASRFALCDLRSRCGGGADGDDGRGACGVWRRPERVSRLRNARGWELVRVLRHPSGEDYSNVVNKDQRLRVECCDRPAGTLGRLRHLRAVTAEGAAVYTKRYQHSVDVESGRLLATLAWGALPSGNEYWLSWAAAGWWQPGSPWCFRHGLRAAAGSAARPRPACGHRPPSRPPVHLCPAGARRRGRHTWSRRLGGVGGCCLRLAGPAGARRPVAVQGAGAGVQRRAAPAPAAVTGAGPTRAGGWPVGRVSVCSTGLEGVAKFSNCGGGLLGARPDAVLPLLAGAAGGGDPNSSSRDVYGTPTTTAEPDTRSVAGPHRQTRRLHRIVGLREPILSVNSNPLTLWNAKKRRRR